MSQLLGISEGNVGEVAAAIDAEIAALSARNTARVRDVRRKYSRALKRAQPEFVLALAARLCKTRDYRWFAYELIQHHPPAFERLRDAEVERLGRGFDSWSMVDAFARTLSGPAW